MYGAFRRATSIDRFTVGADRRAKAPHPGPLIKREYLDPLGYDVASFAAHLGVDPGLLGSMLEGKTSIDVRMAVRIARALDLPAERIVQMQLRNDFAAARAFASVDDAPLLRPLRTEAFADTFRHGHLGCSNDRAGGSDSLFFRENVPLRVGDDFAGLHALWRGDRLRVYDPAGAVQWSGPILNDLEGRIFFPYVLGTIAYGWFAAAYRADLAVCSEHAAYLSRASQA